MGRSSVEAIETKEMDYQSLPSPQHQEAPYIHKVGVPPKQNLFDEFKSTVKETLFSDDPLRPFKDQTKSRKFVLGLQAVFCKWRSPHFQPHPFVENQPPHVL